MKKGKFIKGNQKTEKAKPKGQGGNLIRDKKKFN